jgi:SAM-dependent methyltransferase
VAVLPAGISETTVLYARPATSASNPIKSTPSTQSGGRHRSDDAGYAACVPEPITETRRTYDVIAEQYARQNSTADPRLIEDMDFMTADLAPASVVADVGCGPGRDIALLRDRGVRAIGLDLSVNQLRTGGLSGVGQADMRHLPLRGGSVDAVWCQAALLHIPRDAVPAVLGEFGRVVRIGGKLYVSVAEGDGEGWEVASNYRSTRRRWFTYQREADLSALLSAAGFQVHHVRRVHSHRDWLSLHSRRVSSPV